MTTICAVKKEKCLYIASDSLALFGSRKEIAVKHVYDSKIIQIGQNFIAASGHPSWGLILKHYFSKKENNLELKSDAQIFNILHDFHQVLRTTYFLNLTYSRYEPFESSNFVFLIINSHGIFEADYLRTIRQHKHFFAIGTGAEYALGAIKAVYNLIDDPKEITKIGIEAAAQFDRNTDLPIQIKCINIE